MTNYGEILRKSEDILNCHPEHKFVLGRFWKLYEELSAKNWKNYPEITKNANILIKSGKLLETPKVNLQRKIDWEIAGTAEYVFYVNLKNEDWRKFFEECFQHFRKM